MQLPDLYRIRHLSYQFQFRLSKLFTEHQNHWPKESGEDCWPHVGWFIRTTGSSSASRPSRQNALTFIASLRPNLRMASTRSWHSMRSLRMCGSRAWHMGSWCGGNLTWTCTGISRYPLHQVGPTLTDVQHRLISARFFQIPFPFTSLYLMFALPHSTPHNFYC